MLLIWFGIGTPIPATRGLPVEFTISIGNFAFGSGDTYEYENDENNITVSVMTIIAIVNVSRIEVYLC